MGARGRCVHVRVVHGSSVQFASSRTVWAQILVRIRRCKAQFLGVVLLLRQIPRNSDLHCNALLHSGVFAAPAFLLLPLFLYRKWKELEWQDQEDSSCISSVFSLLRCCRCPVSHSLVRLASKCDWALKSCDAAFEQTLFCGWCCSYCLGNFSCDQVQVSYHDWLHKEDERRHREAYVAERAAEYAERRGT